VNGVELETEMSERMIYQCNRMLKYDTYKAWNMTMSSLLLKISVTEVRFDDEGTSIYDNSTDMSIFVVTELVFTQNE
jgi:hypothetical protein